MHVHYPLPRAAEDARGDDRASSTSGSPSGVVLACGKAFMERTYNGMPGRLLPGSGGVAIRNSRDRDGPALVYTRDEVAAFLGGVLDGDFDDLLPAAPI